VLLGFAIACVARRRTGSPVRGRHRRPRSY
jgi:hypothetical protein